MTIAERHYAIVRVRTEAGLEGYAYGQTRGAPVVEIVDRLLSPVLLGGDSAAIEDRWTDCYHGTIAVGRVGLVIRAISLIDIALWDIRSQREGEPLCRALGGNVGGVDVMKVVGYPSSAADVDVIVDAATKAAEDGHIAIKIARSLDPAVTRQTLRAFDVALPADVRVTVDANWVWSDPAQALAELDGWPLPLIGWLEDPFPPESIDAYRALHDRAPVPIGVGEEVTDPAVHRSLIATQAADVVRIDLTTIGGYTKGAHIARMAKDADLPVSFHVYPEISVQAAVAWGCHSIETFERSENPYDPSHALVDGGPQFGDGRAQITDSPGIGFTIDPGRFAR
jgi:L-alanine-DL-glutamate epimerase-like enolase superfamily enzyme